MRIGHTYIIEPYQMMAFKWHWAFIMKGFSALIAYYL